MAEAILLPIQPTYNTHIECTNYPAFENYGWERLYTNYMTNVLKSLEIYSDISRLYLLIKLDLSNNILTDAISKLSTDKLNQLPEAVQLTINLKGIMPDADPIYLELVGEMYTHNNIELCEFIEKVTTNRKSYPKVREYNERIKILNIIKRLTLNFNVQEFLSMCPDPINYFKNVKVNSMSIHYNESVSYLSERFCLMPIATIRAELQLNKFNLTDTYESLKSKPNVNMLKNKRKSFCHRQVNFKLTDNVEFLKEIAYLDHKDDILNHIETEKTIYTIQLEEARSVGRLCTCECCFNNELLPLEIHCCPVGHQFCSSCIKKGIEISVGSSKLDLKCFADCTKEFDLVMVEKIIDEKLFQRITRLKQAQEIRAAGIEGLETCAFCDYSVILAPDLKTINCLNPECKKETCRKCREESHFPFRCDQIEKAPEVKIRTMIENKMTEVLIRTCYFCQRKFVKEDGCNKMTCDCGKQMCYICRQPVDGNYSHFYHTHTIENKCPLYTDENIVHSTAVEAAARLIMNELKEKQPELLRNINIDKILPELRKKKTNSQPHTSNIDVNKVVATVTGHNVEDIVNLKDMRTLEPQPKKAKH